MRKKIRLDWILQGYIREGLASSAHIGNALAPPVTSPTKLGKQAAAAIRKVWYNELAYATPSLVDPFRIDKVGVTANITTSRQRMVFPSWRIPQAYYAVYHAYRALCEITDTPYRAEEHASPLRSFKASKLSPAFGKLLAFPFNIHYGPSTRGKAFSDLFLPESKPYLKSEYASHPRPPHSSFHNVLKRIVAAFRGGWNSWSLSKRENQPFMLPDLLYDFRTWANYIDIDNMVALKSPGLKAYLDVDLSTIIFFHAALVELAAIAVFGPRDVTHLAASFHEGFVQQDPTLWHCPVPRPMDIRFHIYAHVGRLGGIRWTPAQPAGSEVSFLGQEEGGS
jgi:hypothetical protein